MPFFIGLSTVQGAENQLASTITTLARTIVKQFGTGEAKVAAVDGDKIYINAGRNQFVTEGKVYQIVADGRAFNDPVSRGKLGTLETSVADIKIVTVRDTYAIGQVVNRASGGGDSQIKVGQRAVEKAAKLTIAVVQFEYLNSKDQVTPKYAQQLMINELIKSGRFTVAESATTDRVVKHLLELNTPGTNPATPDTLGSVQFTRNLGKMLGVSYIMYGQLTDLPGFMEIQCRVHDAKTGVGIAAANQQIVPVVVNSQP